MAKTVSYTVSYGHDGFVVDLCKIIFGGDGSYFVTAPYHPHDQAVAGILTVNYAFEENNISLTDSVDLALVDDDDQRLKLSHHPDGFLQFSGQGITSGRDDTGKPKGMGVFSWPLFKPTLGPSFSIAFSDPAACGRRVDVGSTPGKNRVILQESEFSHMRSSGVTGIVIIGYYFPALWREFVVPSFDGGWVINLVHPEAQAVKPLKVIMASTDSDFPGLIGIEARPHVVETKTDIPGFFMSSSTGGLRRNKNGDLLGDQLFCMYPAMDLADASLPSLNFGLNAPPYKAPPGSPV